MGLLLFSLLNVTSLSLFLLSILHPIHFGGVAISFYGTFVLLYFIGQLGSSVINRRRTLASPPRGTKPYRTAVLVVGYREDPRDWKACLEGLIAQDYPLGLILACIDGDEAPDVEMGDSARALLASSGRPWEVHECAHGGKRSALANGFHILTSSYPEMDAVVLCDSDTRYKPDAVSALVSCLSSDDRVGCATGSLRVFDNHFLGRIVNARYAFAFDIERASMSTFGIMTCCSGPLSIYRASIVLDPEFIEEFTSQTYCGKPCHPGDDRHLTYLVMKRGYRSLQTHLATGLTDAPGQLIRFLKQQLRWIRSFYREMPYQLHCLASGKQHWALAVVTHYELMYPYLLMSWVVWSLLSRAPSLVVGLRTALISLCLCLFRVAFSIIFQRGDLTLLWGTMYLPLYFFLIFPLKPLALITSGVQGWATTARLYGKSIVLWDMDVVLIVVSVLAWNTFLTERFVHHLMAIITAAS